MIPFEGKSSTIPFAGTKKRTAVRLANGSALDSFKG